MSAAGADRYPSPGLRILIAATVLLGLNYVVWRWLFSVNWSAWWIAVPLVVAETYSLIDSMLFGLTMWRWRRRAAPPAAPDGLTVDVFITTYNEPVDLVTRTAEAAARIRYPHETWILDDGERPELQSAAAELGVRYMTRAASWTNKPRHAKAGNLNNALLHTHGEFILVLDADQVPDPEILHRTLGYFQDERTALVQTPQYFVNVPESDPLGSQAPLFYGPIQQGKDGWNAAFFCGSNAILRREALMQLGITGYVRAVEEGVVRALRTAGKVLDRARSELGANQPEVLAALDSVRVAVRTARAAVRQGQPLAEVTYRFQQSVDEAARIVVDANAGSIRADLEAIAALTAAPRLRGRRSSARRDDTLAPRRPGMVTARGARVDSHDDPRRRRQPRRRGGADAGAGDDLGDRGHGHVDAPARDGLEVGLSPRGAGARSRARGRGHDAHPAAALGAGHDPGDVA